jgi:hypothetical protein
MQTMQGDSFSSLNHALTRNEFLLHPESGTMHGGGAKSLLSVMQPAPALLSRQVALYAQGIYSVASAPCYGY